MGKKYSTLDPELQGKFLGYPIAVGQLLNATDSDVFEVFARLNSYNVQLNAPEKRHAKYQGDFKWTVHESSLKWNKLWDDYKVVSQRERVRMLSDSLMAEMYGVVLEGVADGGQAKIDKLYARCDRSFDHAARAKVDQVLTYFVANLGDDLRGTPCLSAPHFLMLFSALAHALVGIPKGELDAIPGRTPLLLSNLQVTRNNLAQINSVIGSEETVARFEEFWTASKATTQRIASRKTRFPVFLKGLLPNPL